MESIEEIHVAMGAAWPGLAQERVGEWLLRFGEGYTSRANSCLPVGDPGCSLVEAVAAVEAAYAARGLAPRYQVPCSIGSSGEPVPVNAALDAFLSGRGYTVATPALVQVAGPTTPDAVRAALALPDHGTRFEWADEPRPGWVSISSDRFRNSPAAVAVTTAHPARYLTLWDGDEPVGRGRTSRAGDWYDVSDLLVVDRLRGRGLGRRMLAELTAEGERLGAGRGVLQVETDNVRAQQLYRSSGWLDVGSYHYRVLAV